MHSIVCFIIGAVLLVSPAFGEELAVEAPDPAYPFWKFGLGIEIDSVGISLDSKVSNQKLSYRPSESRYAGIILGYRWAAGTIAFAIPADRKIRDVEGQSEYRDYRLSYYKKNWGLEGAYNRYKGYLIENSDQLSATTLAGAKYYRKPEMTSFGFGISGFYLLKPGKYSLAAAFDQSQPQNGSDGSWVFIGTFRKQAFRDRTGIVPAANVTNFGPEGAVIGVTSTVAALGMGYGYLWDGPYHLFASGFLGVTGGINQMSAELPTVEHSRTTAQTNAHVRLAFGWNSQTGFAKIAVAIDDYGYSTDSLEIHHSMTSGILTGGVRF